MIKNRVPIYEVNTSRSEFVPSDPSLNVALQNKEMDVQYDAVKIEDMRDNPMYDNSVSGFDRVALMEQAQLKHVASLQEYAKQVAVQHAHAQHPKF